MPTEQPLRLTYLADPNETHTRRWLGWFAAQGHHVELIGPSGTSLTSPLPDGIGYRALPAYGGHRIRPLGYLEARRAVRASIAETDPDVVHAHYLTGYGWLAWLSGFRPYVISVWGSDIFRTLPASRFARVLGGRALAGAAAVTADSRDLADGAIRAGARADRTSLVQFGVDTARFAPGARDADLRARLGIGPGRIVFAARTLIDFYRNDVVVDALPTLPDDVQLVFTARNADPGTRRRLEDRAASLGVRDRVTILDHVAHEDMAPLLRLSDVLVSIPETDGTPVTILEALAVGVPVVASDVPSVREWVGERAPGHLVPVGDVAATAAAIRASLSLAPEAAAALARAGRALVEAAADQDANMQAMEQQYRRLAARRPAARAAARRSAGATRDDRT